MDRETAKVIKAFALLYSPTLGATTGKDAEPHAAL
jgi:hypothetical protein